MENLHIFLRDLNYVDAGGKYMSNTDNSSKMEADLEKYWADLSESQPNLLSRIQALKELLYRSDSTLPPALALTISEEFEKFHPKGKEILVIF